MRSLFRDCAAVTLPTVAAMFGGCSDSNGFGPPGAPATPDDGGNDADPVGEDAGDAHDAAPTIDAAPPSYAFPVAATSGGPVVAKPKITVVTFAGDALEPSIGAFNDALVTSTWFGSASKEYGVGPILSVSHARLMETAPAAITDAEIRTWLATAIGTTLGPLDTDTLYALYYPAGTAVTYAGKTSCNGYQGYHGEIAVSGSKAAFAVLPRCDSTDPSLTTLDVLTRVASHELFEWATDPYPLTAQAWHKVKPESAPWALAFEGELADLCDGRTSQTKPADLGFFVQSVWSNVASAAGRAPCQPGTQPVYATLIPRATDRITLSPSLMTATSVPATGTVPGVIVAPGTSVKVPVHVYAESSTTTKWQLTATEGGSMLPAANLGLALDRTDALAGEDVTLTVTAPASLNGPTIVVLYLNGAGTSIYTRWPLLIAPSASP